MSKTIGNHCFFGTWLDRSCGLMDMYILVMVMYALGRISTPPKPMAFHRFSMVPGNAPGRQNRGGALTISSHPPPTPRAAQSKTLVFKKVSITSCLT